MKLWKICISEAPGFFKRMYVHTQCSLQDASIPSEVTFRWADETSSSQKEAFRSVAKLPHYHPSFLSVGAVHQH